MESLLSSDDPTPNLLMGFTKYQRTESSAPVSKQGHKAIESELRKVGKSSMTDLDEEERKSVTKTLDERS